MGAMGVCSQVGAKTKQKKDQTVEQVMFLKYGKGQKIHHIGKDGGGVQGGSRGEMKREVRG